MSETWVRRAPLTGIVAGAFILLAFIVGGLDTPSFDASAKDIVDYWDDGAQIASALLAGLGAIFVVFFAATLRSRMRSSESLSSLTLVGGGLFALGVGVLAGLSFALADLAGSDKHIDPGALQALNVLNEDLFLPGVIGLCVFYISTGLATLGTGAMPRWFGWVSVVLGVLCVAGPAGFAAFLLSPIWLIVAAILLMRSDSASGATHRENAVGATTS
jgi:hypothetical protein